MTTVCDMFLAYMHIMCMCMHMHCTHMHMHMHSSWKESAQQVATYLPSDHARTNERTKNHQTPSAVAALPSFLRWALYAR